MTTSRLPAPTITPSAPCTASGRLLAAGGGCRPPRRGPARLARDRGRARCGPCTRRGPRAATDRPVRGGDGTRGRQDHVRRRATGSRCRSSRAAAIAGRSVASRRARCRPAACRARRSATPRRPSGRSAPWPPSRPSRSDRADLPYLDPTTTFVAQPAAAVDPGRAQARGLRLPAVLGADATARPGSTGRSSRPSPTSASGRAANGTLQKRNSDGSTTVGWSGWTSSKMTVGHQRRPRQRRPGRPDRPELRLVLDRRGAPEVAPRQLGQSGQPRPPDRGGRPRSRRGRRQPRLRADRLDLRRRVHLARPGGPVRAEQGRTRATS